MGNIHTDLGPFEIYAEARRVFLSHIGCEGSCRDPLAEFSEWIVNKELNGKLAESRTQKGYDLVRPDGRRVQVKYLSNPSSSWINGHRVLFTEDMDQYAIVFYEAMALTAIVIFCRETIGDVCRELGKRHPDQNRCLDVYKKNLDAILSDPERFEELGVEVYVPSET